MRADIDYGVATAKTTYGTCGVKVWIFKGEIMEHDPMAVERRNAENTDQGRGQQQQERKERPAASAPAGE